VNGIEIAYEEHGGGTRPFVLLHGFTGSRQTSHWASRSWQRSARRAAGPARSRRVDEHGEDGYSFDQLGRSARVLDAPQIELRSARSPMGGMVALRAALHRPERFASLVMMETSARVPDNLAREPIELAARIAREAGMPQLAKLMRARAASPDASRTDADRRLEAEWGDRYWDEWRFPNYHAMDPHAFGALGAALFDQTPLGARLAEIRCPTLVIVGSGDTGFLAAADELVRDIPDARLALIPEAGHQPQLENPAAWLAALGEDLARVRG
jgi:pimeloyl-ACP methyl ester carboxylesterase